MPDQRYEIAFDMPGQDFEVGFDVQVSDKVSQNVAEAWATGQRGGVNVGEGDPTYHNNAKYYAEKAGTDAGSAHTDAEAAEASKTAAAASETRVANYAVAASGSAADAATSEGNAAQSATAASDSATAAAQSATDAEASKTDAAGILTQVQQVQASIPADYTTLDRLQQLQAENIPGTIQKYVFSGGNVQKVIHQQGETAVRTDVFTYGGETITETRTLATGEKLEIVTNLSTLETTTAYTAA